MTDIAIRASHLSKCYHIYNNPHDRLKQFVAPRLQRLIGQKPKQYFHEFWALNDVSFEIKKGETVGIIGRNGSGKSTLLQLICGTLTPSHGQVEINGRVAALLELGSGFNPEFTGRENVYMNAAVLGLSREQVEERFDDIVTFADIGEFIEQPVKTYSSGMMVRLAFAVIAHVDADILVVDEALSVGDAIFVQKCNRFIRSFLEKGTLLFVSHSTQSVLELCDRSIWLRHGEISEDGEAKEVVRHYSAYVHQQINADVNISVSVKEKISTKKLNNPNKDLDKRSVWLADSNLKFKLELFGFDFNSAYWGAEGATIIDMELLDENGMKLSVIENCGSILVRVHCLAKVELLYPIIGISLRNQRGVELISENTALSYLQDMPPSIVSGKEFYADFKFFLPYLPLGEYTLGAAIADGLPGKHIQHHRRDDALRFTVLSSHLVYGMFAMPLEDCCIVLKN